MIICNPEVHIFTEGGLWIINFFLPGHMPYGPAAEN